MSQFETFLNNNDPIISNVAKLLDALLTQFNANQLSESEYKELCANVLTMGRIDTLATTIERKAEIEKAFAVLTSLIGL